MIIRGTNGQRAEPYKVNHHYHLVHTCTDVFQTLLWPLTHTDTYITLTQEWGTTPALTSLLTPDVVKMEANIG